MKKFILMGLILVAGFTQAQDMFQEALFSTDFIFSNRDKIALTDAQEERIKKIQDQQAGDFSKMKKELAMESARLQSMLSELRPDTEKVQKQMDAVLAIENSMKKKQLITLVAIKNELTENQHKQLRVLKNSDQVSSAETNLLGIAEQKVKLTLGGDSESRPPFYRSTKKGLSKIADVSKINPEDISSIEVVKGKGALDRFGEEGRNGVVIITLKKDDVLVE